MPEPPSDPTTTRTWLLRTLDEAGDRIARAIDAGVVDPAPRWTDPDNVEITAASHGSGVTLSATRPDGSQLERIKIPLGWTQPVPVGE